MLPLVPRGSLALFCLFSKIIGGGVCDTFRPLILMEDKHALGRPRLVSLAYRLANARVLQQVADLTCHFHQFLRVLRVALLHFEGYRLLDTR